MIANKRHVVLIFLVFFLVDANGQNLAKRDSLHFPILFEAADHSLDPVLINFRIFSKSTRKEIGLTKTAADGRSIFQLHDGDPKDSLIEMGLAPSGFFFIIGERPIVDFETTERIEVEVHKVKFPRTVYLGFVASSVHYLIEIRNVRPEGTQSYFYSIVPKLWPKEVKKVLKAEKAIARKPEEIFKSFKQEA